jgi:hypothetical protein
MCLMVIFDLEDIKQVFKSKLKKEPVLYLWKQYPWNGYIVADQSAELMRNDELICDSEDDNKRFRLPPYPDPSLHPQYCVLVII